MTAYPPANDRAQSTAARPSSAARDIGRVVSAFLGRTPAARPLPASVSTPLDVARGLAAVAVLAGHVRALLFVEYLSVAPGHRTPLVALAYALTGFGHQAVIVFFVLSGFLISRSVVRSAAGRRWSWASYAEQRLTRLYVVLVPALLLTAAWDRLGIALLGARGIYGGAARNTVLTFAVSARDGFAPFAANLLFVQEILSPPFGSNAPLWSLSYEFWYYVAFPALLVAVTGCGARVRSANALVAAIALACVGPAIRTYFAVWLLGFAATLPSVRRVGSRAARALAVVAGVTSFGVLALTRAVALGRSEFRDLVLGVSFAALLSALMQLPSGAPKEPRVRTPCGAAPTNGSRLASAARVLAGFSYTLYLVHLPPLVLFSGVVTHDGRAPWQPDGAHAALALLAAAALLAYAYGVSRVTEARTERVRVALRPALGRLGRAGKFTPRPSAQPPG